MKTTTLTAFSLVILGVALASAPALAVNVTIDYTYDATSFFGSGNPDGALAGANARASIEAAADFLSEILDDSFSGISTPDPYYSSSFNGIATWEWEISFSDPSTGSPRTLVNQSIAENEYRIYAGSRNIAGTTIGFGGPGGWSWSTGGNGGGFTAGEIDEINAITDSFDSDIETRGEPIGEFANWGGAVTFDPSTDWHWDHTTSPGFNQSDFFSVALHELVHAVGFGTSNEWTGLVTGGAFYGAASRAANNDAYPTITGGHWTEGTQSTVFGASTPQEVLMDPQSENGHRQYLTTLDAAGLTDIGWTVVEPSAEPLPGDYDGDGDIDTDDYLEWRMAFGLSGPHLADGNGDGVVDTADYTVWRDAYTPLGDTLGGKSNPAPEPSSIAVVSLIALAGLFRKRRPNAE